MDEKDEKIIEILKENSNLSTHKISKKSGIPITTVHHRIKKLEKDGIIKKYTIELDQKKIGKPISAYIFITVDYKAMKEQDISQTDVAEKFRKMDYVKSAAIIAGERDLLLKIRAKDMDQLNDMVINNIRNTEVIERTQTIMVLKEV